MTSLFQPAGDCKVKKRPEGKSPSIDMPDCRSNDKRQLSVSPSRRIKKRRTLHTSGDDKAQKHLAYKDLPTDWLMGRWKPDEERKDRDAKMLQLVYHVGNMFENAPENCLLVHACNTQGHWGAGIAKAFKQQYPKAYTAHHNFCTKEHDPTEPVPTGSAQLLAPVDGISQQWIGCLFTSAKYGKAKDKADVIVENSIASLRMLLELVSVGGEDVGEIRMCKINSGKFGVPWEKTEEALKRVVLQEGWRDTMHIWEP